MNKRVDWLLLLPSLCLVLLSLATFYALDVSIFRQQAISLVIAIVIYFITININFSIFPHYAKFFYIFMIVGLLLLFVIGIEAKGAVRWIDFFGISIQFSEIFKPLFVLFFASYLTQNSNRSFVKNIVGLLLFAPIFFLILKQPDLGSALIYFVTLILLFISYRFPFYHFITLGIAAVLPLPILFNLLHDYQKERIYSFLNHTSDPYGISYNAVQSMISVGSGGFFGKGFGEGTQSILRFLPERHTDFIFATMSETLGFFGGLIVLVLYFLLLYRMYKISTTLRDSYSSLVVLGFYYLMLVHVFFNIGMNIGILPIVGITLPFFSYGGSSLLTNFMILGVITSMSYEYRKSARYEIR